MRPPAGPSPATVARVVGLRRASARRAGVTAILLGGALGTLACAALALGDYPLTLAEVVSALAGGGERGAAFVVAELRLPRMVVGLAAGAALGLSGAVFQTLARNPLASPDLLGVTQGAAAGAVAALALFGGRYQLIAAGALAGALGVTALMHALAGRDGASPQRLVLVGVGVGAAATALTSFLLTRAEVYSAASALVWLTGSLSSQTWGVAGPAAVAVAGLGIGVALLGRTLGALRLDDDSAAATGMDVGRARRACSAAGAGLAGVATAAAGPVAFVALVAPAAARAVRGAGPALVHSALTGALLVVMADLAGRLVFGAVEVPAGVLTGVLGGAYLLGLLVAANRRGVS